MKKILFVLLLFQLSTNLFGQEEYRRVKDLTLKIVENVIKDTSTCFVDAQTGKVIDIRNFTDLNQIRIENRFSTWNYWNGVINIALNRLSEMLNDDKFRNIADSRYYFVFQKSSFFGKDYNGFNKWNYPFGQFLFTQELDDCGAMSAGLADIYYYDKNPEYLKYMNRVADFMINKNYRLPDGTFSRLTPREMTIWADDLYMSVPFLARMGKLTGNTRYFDEAVKQVENFSKYLTNPVTNLYYHCWYSESNMNGVATWGRCNGWIMMAQVELLNNLPENHPKREELIMLLKKQIVAVSRYQSPQGMWHQLLDKQDSYLETSATAMFIYSIAKAVNEKWIGDSFFAIAENGWNGLLEKIDTDGNVAGICVGTGIEEDLAYYYHRPSEINDIHGLGAIILAGIEMMRNYKR